jgi:hypothetical protein
VLLLELVPRFGLLSLLMLVFDVVQINLSLAPIPDGQQCTNGDEGSDDPPKAGRNVKPQNNLGGCDEDRKASHDASQGAKNHKECVSQTGQFWAVIKMSSIHCRSLARAPGSSVLMIVPLRAICGRFFGIITTEVLLGGHMSGGRLLVKLRVSIIAKLQAQASEGVFSLPPQLLPLSGGRSWWIGGCAV